MRPTSSLAAARGGNQLTVNFTDDKTLEGMFDGETISWDNGTKWTKQ
ncbi:hypothetical protein [Methylosinus sporium]